MSLVHFWNRTAYANNLNCHFRCWMLSLVCLFHQIPFGETHLQDQGSKSSGTDQVCRVCRKYVGPPSDEVAPYLSVNVYSEHLSWAALLRIFFIHFYLAFCIVPYIIGYCTIPWSHKDTCLHRPSPLCPPFWFLFKPRIQNSYIFSLNYLDVILDIILVYL